MFAAVTSERNRARGLANAAQLAGRLVHQPCEACGDQPALKHHDDYRQPLQVRWLCVACHASWHRAHRRACPRCRGRSRFCGLANVGDPRPLAPDVPADFPLLGLARQLWAAAQFGDHERFSRLYRSEPWT